MKKRNFSNIYHEKSQKDNLVITSTQFLQSRNSELAFRGNSLLKPRFFAKNTKKNKYRNNTSATFFIKKNLIFESIKNPENPINTIWNSKNTDKKCDFFPFIQERDHLNRLIQENVEFFCEKYSKIMIEITRLMGY